MIQLNVDSGNPMRAVQQLLDATMIQVLAMREAIKLMEVPAHHWKFRKLAEIHTQTLETSLQRLIKDHIDVCARLKELGY
jgi:flagellin-specific chaperone FliS